MISHAPPRRPRGLGFAVLVTVAALLAGCGGGGEPGSRTASHGGIGPTSPATPDDVRRQAGMKPTQARAIEPPPPAAHEIASPLTRGHEALAVGTVDSRLANAQVRYRNVAEGLGDAILRWEDRVTVTLARVQKLMAQVKAAKTPPQHRGASGTADDAAASVSALVPAASSPSAGSEQETAHEGLARSLGEEEPELPQLSAVLAQGRPRANDPTAARLERARHLAERCRDLGAMLEALADELSAAADGPTE